MGADAPTVATAFLDRHRRAAVHRALVDGVRALPVLAGLVAVAVVLARAFWGRDGVRAWQIAWGIAFALFVVRAGLAAWPTAQRRRRYAAALDHALAAHGAILAATDRLPASSRLLPLVRERAEAFLAAKPRDPMAAPIPSRSLSALLVLLPLSFAATCWVGLGRSEVIGWLERSAQQLGVLESPSPFGHERAEPEAAPSTDLFGASQIELTTNRRLYGLGEPISTTVRFRLLGDLEADLAIDCVLAVANGSERPDQGFGPGFCRVPLLVARPVGRAVGSEVVTTLDLRPVLEALGMGGPGLITLEAAAAASELTPSFVGGVRSAQHTIQISENRESEQQRRPTPVGNSAATQPATKPEPKESQVGKDPGAAPAEGQQDELGGATRQEQVVEPLLSEAPLIEKDAHVVDRERGDPLASPSPSDPSTSNPLRTFLRVDEAALRLSDPTAQQRALLRRYFERLDRRR